MVKRVLRYTIGIDDQPHEIPLGVPVLFGRSGASQTPGAEGLIDVWLEVHTPNGWPSVPDGQPVQQVQIVGTGHPVPDTWTWLASVDDDIAGPTLVWHLYRLPT